MYVQVELSSNASFRPTCSYISGHRDTKPFSSPRTAYPSRAADENVIVPMTKPLSQTCPFDDGTGISDLLSVSDYFCKTASIDMLV